MSRMYGIYVGIKKITSVDNCYYSYSRLIRCQPPMANINQHNHSQPWPPPAETAPQCPTWGLALCTNVSNGWATTPQASRYNFWGCWGCVWPSKHSDIVAMHHHRNKGLLWGPYTPSIPPKNTSPSSEDCSSIWSIGAERKASGGVLGGHFLPVAAMAVAVVMPVVFCAKATEILINAIKTLKLVVCKE